MGVDASFGVAFAKAQMAAGALLPVKGKAFLSVRDEDKAATVPVARRLARSGFALVATRGTAAYLRQAGVEVEVINKVLEGGPHIVDAIRAGEIALVINTPGEVSSVKDSFSIRRSALECQIPYFTTIAGAEAAAEGIERLCQGEISVKPLQEYHASVQQSAISSALHPAGPKEAGSVSQRGGPTPG
jgi:carbamoyl-phosphate synthase large subunit